MNSQGFQPGRRQRAPFLLFPAFCTLSMIFTDFQKKVDFYWKEWQSLFFAKDCKPLFCSKDFSDFFAYGGYFAYGCVGTIEYFLAKIAFQLKSMDFTDMDTFLEIGIQNLQYSIGNINISSFSRFGVLFHGIYERSPFAFKSTF